MTVPGRYHNYDGYPTDQKPSGLGPNPEFAVKSYGDNDPYYVDNPSLDWAAKLHPVPGGTPDPMRTLQFPVRDYRPAPGDPPEDFWLGVNGPGREKVQRHGVEFQDADGIEAVSPGSISRAPDPRWVPVPESRLTQRLSPHNYLFTRPYDQTIARRLNGEHFSMADHRRTYPILGMQPPTRKRNTFRADPPPWDTDLVDMPPYVPPVFDGRIPTYEVPATRNWRLA